MTARRAARGKGAWAVIAGGGTAGHVQPGLAVAHALVARGHEASSIQWVGSARGIEARLVPEAGLPLVLLPGRGIQRRMTPANLVALAGLTAAVVAAFSIVLRRRPAVVLALGGYASVPCALAAAALRVPVVVVEQNAVPGAANRLVARFARATAAAFPGTPLPRAVVTGNPVRAQVAAVDRTRDRGAARASLGLPAGRKVVAIFGGSLGARRLNLALVGALPLWKDRDDLAVHHVVGERDWPLVKSALAELPAGHLAYQPVRYEDRMDLMLAAADLAVCRAGATTVAELAVTRLPAVLVPLPGAPGDHQTANGQVLVEAGAAVMVADRDFDGARLALEVERLLGEPARLDAMAQAAVALGRPGAADAVAELVEAHACR